MAVQAQTLEKKLRVLIDLVTRVLNALGYRMKRCPILENNLCVLIALVTRTNCPGLPNKKVPHTKRPASPDEKVPPY